MSNHYDGRIEFQQSEPGASRPSQAEEVSLDSRLSDRPGAVVAIKSTRHRCLCASSSRLPR